MSKNQQSIIVVGDLHVDARTLPGGSWGDPEMCRRRNMSMFTSRTMSTIHELVEDNNAAAVVFTGDIFDTGKPLVSDAITVQRELAGIDADVYVVTGNHDIKGLDSASENPLVQLFSDTDNVTVISSDTLTTPVGNVDVTFLPWPDEGGSFASLISKASKSDIIMGHANIDGAAGDRDSISTSQLKRKWPRGIFGHVHTPTDGDYMYVGASKHNSLLPGSTETSNDNFVVVNIGGDNAVSVERVDRSPGFMCVVAGSDDDIDVGNVDGVIIEGDHDGKLSDLREAGLHVTRRPLKTASKSRKSEPLRYDGKDFDIVNVVVSSLDDGTDTAIARDELSKMVNNL